MRGFLERYEFLLLPTVQVPPFPVDQPFVTEINGVKLANYMEWMKFCYMIPPAATRRSSSPPLSRTMAAGGTADRGPLPG